ncbi:MAG: trypsin-like peptidase domain-containing protein [Candidatus Limnocylindrales bacterium]
MFRVCIRATSSGLGSIGDILVLAEAVTNAHVVAGSDKVWISFNGELDRHPAEVVLYDPELDVALLYEADVRLTPLTLSGSVAERGQQAAALGYTGGGGLRSIPAVVSRDLDAVGRDIYGSNIVERSVIELRENVAPGDSGGPLLIAGGDVLGVTFSKSQSDPQIGYALAAAAVEHSIAPSLDSSNPADTQSCIQH